ncbi:MAG: hypothetical protein ABI333_03385 [bacterium]
MKREAYTGLSLNLHGERTSSSAQRPSTDHRQWHTSGRRDDALTATRVSAGSQTLSKPFLALLATGNGAVLGTLVGSTFGAWAGLGAGVLLAIASWGAFNSLIGSQSEAPRG